MRLDECPEVLVRRQAHREPCATEPQRERNVWLHVAARAHCDDCQMHVSAGLTIIEDSCFIRVVSDNETDLPPAIARVLRLFRQMGREEKMQALIGYARKLEPLPARFAQLDRDLFTVPECQTRVDLFPELREGKLYFWADLNVRQSPTIAAFLQILFSAVNGQSPHATLAIPSDFVRRVMDGIGLGTRETGLNAMLLRLKRHARDAELAIAGGRPDGIVSGAPGEAAPGDTLPRGAGGQ